MERGLPARNLLRERDALAAAAARPALRRARRPRHVGQDARAPSSTSCTAVAFWSIMVLGRIHWRGGAGD